MFCNNANVYEICSWKVLKDVTTTSSQFVRIDETVTQRCVWFRVWNNDPSLCFSPNLQLIIIFVNVQQDSDQPCICCRSVVSQAASLNQCFLFFFFMRESVRICFDLSAMICFFLDEPKSCHNCHAWPSSFANNEMIDRQKLTGKGAQSAKTKNFDFHCEMLLLLACAKAKAESKNHIFFVVQEQEKWHEEHQNVTDQRCSVTRQTSWPPASFIRSQS